MDFGFVLLVIAASAVVALILLAIVKHTDAPPKPWSPVDSWF